MCKLNILNDCMEIQLSRNQFAIVDKSSYEKIKPHSWYAIYCYDRFYAAATIRKKTVLMHRFLTNAPNGKIVDHIDGNSLNNSLSNLRVCTQSENIQNQRPKKKGMSSKYQGVYFAKNINKWRAQARINGKTTHLGCFPTEYEAAIAYNAAVSKAYGIHAKLN